ncbi:MAG: hypothetical protein HUJ29_03630 [Gammaproteobacteria bacterium]|nr:hypothetical protein [Gammaproteobacteria bacterium]
MAALVFCILIAIAVAFQLALAAGMPWGEFAMGGKFPGRLPPAMRVGAVIQAIILVLFGLVVLSAAGVGPESWHAFSDAAIWFVFGFSVLSSLLNAVSPSQGERLLWTPIAMGLALCSLLVAID